MPASQQQRLASIAAALTKEQQQQHVHSCQGVCVCARAMVRCWASMVCFRGRRCMYCRPVNTPIA
jgi:hypothetical protein